MYTWAQMISLEMRERPMRPLCAFFHSNPGGASDLPVQRLVS